jgi:hypothetical protein
MQQPDTGTNYIAEIGDFLFATDTIAKIAKGEGTWADAALVGVTAASFFIPPAKLTQLSTKALNAARVAATKTAANEAASVAAKRAAQRTVNNIDDMRGQKKYISDKPGARSRYDDEAYDGFSNVEDPYPRQITPDSVRNLGQPKSAPDKTFAADQPSSITPGLTKAIDDLYDKKARGKISDATFNTRRAQILVKLFPEQELLPDVADISRTADELITSSGSITNAKKKEIIRNLKKSDNPDGSPKKPEKLADDRRLAEELEDLDLKTLKQEVTITPGKRKRDPQRVTTKEVPSETAGARSAIQPELDDVLYQKELAEGMLKTAEDPDVIKTLKREIERLDLKATRLQGAIDDPYSITAINQTKKTIPNIRPGRESVEYEAPRSYRAKESVKKSGKAPDSPRRSTLSELKSDEETILKQLKTAEPGQRKALQADLTRTRQEIMNVEVGRLRQSLDDQVKNIPAASKSVESLTLRELESELTRLRSAHKKLSKFKSKQAEEALEEITARGKAVRELLDEAKKRSGKPASDMADIKGKAKPDKGEKSSRLKITEDNIDLLVEAERDALIDGDFTEYNELVKQLMRDQ